jgi:hypothetical protein
MVGVGSVGVGPVVVGVARKGVGEGMLIRVTTGVGIPSKENEQPVRVASRQRLERVNTVLFMILLSNILIVSPPSMRIHWSIRMIQGKYCIHHCPGEVYHPGAHRRQPNISVFPKGIAAGMQPGVYYSGGF